MLSKDTEQLMVKRWVWKEFLKAIKGGVPQGAWSARAQFSDWVMVKLQDHVTGVYHYQSLVPASLGASGHQAVNLSHLVRVSVAAQ